MKRKYSSLLLVMLLVFNVCSVAYANGFNSEENKFINASTYNDDKLYFQLRSIGFSDEEIVELYQKESDKTGINFELPNALKETTNLNNVISNQTNTQALLLRANTGDVRNRTISINFADIARYCGQTGGGSGAAFIIGQVTKNQFIKAFVATAGLGWVTAVISIAGVIFGELSINNQGVTLYLQERYAYDEYEGFGKWYMVDISHRIW